MKKAISRIIAITIIAFGLAACAAGSGSIDWNAARKVKEGMTKEEVTALMGNPYSVTTKGKEEQVWVWVHVKPFAGASHAALTFKEGKVKQAWEVPPDF
jgi:outer membrane protein assembly factor BamE (lipoprotein component of BamABCDE complex)